MHPAVCTSMEYWKVDNAEDLAGPQNATEALTPASISL